MKNILNIVSIFLCFTIQSQELQNERYKLGDEATIFTSVYSTDSCYFISAGIGEYSRMGNEIPLFTKFNFTTNTWEQKIVKKDSLEITPYFTTKITPTLDGNFVQCFLGYVTGQYHTLIFTKFNPNGDTIFSKNYLNEVEFQMNSLSSADEIIENEDGTFYIAFSNNNQVHFTKLSENGEIINDSFHEDNYFNSFVDKNINCNSLLKINENRFLIGSYVFKGHFVNDEFRSHTNIVVVDSLGELVENHYFHQDSINLNIRSMTKTADGGILYCGENGRFFEDEGAGYNGYRGNITKLDSNLNFDWRIEPDQNFLGEQSLSFREIQPVNDSEYVAIGNYRNNGYINADSNFTRYGRLVKFNINGEILWERKYTKVPHNFDELHFPDHELFGFDITADGGFVLVGNTSNRYTNNGEIYGYQGWLLKVDKHGCLVPKCHIYDDIDTTQTTDSTIFTIDSVITFNEPLVWPNPASDNLHLYHQQNETEESFSTAYLYNRFGQIVNQWALNENNMTYIVNVSEYEAGMYVLKIVSNSGIILRTHKIIVEH